MPLPEVERAETGEWLTLSQGSPSQRGKGFPFQSHRPTGGPDREPEAGWETGMRLPRLEELGQHQPGEVPSRRQPNSSSDSLTLSSSQLAAQGKATASIVVAFGLSPLAEGQVCV